MTRCNLMRSSWSLPFIMWLKLHLIKTRKKKTTTTTAVICQKKSKIESNTMWIGIHCFRYCFSLAFLHSLLFLSFDIALLLLLALYIYIHLMFLLLFSFSFFLIRLRFFEMRNHGITNIVLFKISSNEWPHYQQMDDIVLFKSLDII